MLKIFSIFIMLGGFVKASWIADLEKFRADREESTRKNWLVVVGLDWLREGENLVGSESVARVKLPASAPAHLGYIHFHVKKAQIEFTHTDGVKFKGQAVAAKKKYLMNPDEDIVEVGSTQFFLIVRSGKYGIRIKDSKAPALAQFHGIKWWEDKPQFRVTGKWKDIPERVLRVPDVLGDVNEEKIKGSVVFTLDGKEYELFPTREKDELFFVFKDQSNGKTSYGTGRFLPAVVEKGGKVTMDFNRAYNPPCAYTKFATCPLPPVENNLKVNVEAGAKSPH